MARGRVRRRVGALGVLGLLSIAVTLAASVVAPVEPVVAQEEPPTTPPPTTAPPTTSPPPTTAPTTQAPTTASTSAPTTPAPETTSPPATPAPTSGGGGAKAPVTTARSKTPARPTTTPAPETTATTPPPSSEPPPTEPATATTPTSEVPTTPSTTTGTTAPPATPVVVDSVPAESVSSAGRVLSFLIIAALGLLATVIAIGSRRRSAVADPRSAPIPPLGLPLAEGARTTGLAAAIRDGGASSAGAPGAATTTAFVPFTRITSASGLVSGEVPVSGVAGARAAHVAGAMHGLYSTVDDEAAAGPITAELDIVDARTPEVTSRFLTNGGARDGDGRGDGQDGSAPGPGAGAGAGADEAPAATGAPRWAVPQQSVPQEPVPQVPVPQDAVAAEPGAGDAPPAASVVADAVAADGDGASDPPPSVIDLVTEARRVGRSGP